MDPTLEARDYAHDTVLDHRYMGETTITEMLENAFRAGWEKHEEMADEIESDEE